MAFDFSANLEAGAREASAESGAWSAAAIKELVVILAAVVLADVAIFRGHGYAGVAAFLFGTLGLLYLGKTRRRSIGATWIVGAMLLLLAAHLVWFGSPFQVVMGLALLVAFATSLDGRKPDLFAVAATGTQSIVAGILAFGDYLPALRRFGPHLNRPGVLSVVLPAMAFAAFGALFILANPDVVTFVSRQLEALLTNLSEWIIRMALRPTEPFFWILIAVAMAGLLRPMSRFVVWISIARKKADAAPSVAPLFVAYQNTLITVIGLFAVYLAYEFYTLWKRDFPEGFYYAGYAHEGAAWLTAALALATLILSLVFSGEILKDPRLPRLRLLAWIWSLQNVLLSLSVYNRLFIYIDFNGMTRMRIVGLFGISVVVAGFVLVVCKILREKDFAWLIHRQAWALALAVYLFLLTPVDALAVSYNVRRILQGDNSASMQIGVQKLDIEGVMALPPLLDVPTTEIREGVRALIAERYLRTQSSREARRQDGWTAYQLSDEVAWERFLAVRDKWKEYEDNEKRKQAIQRFHAFAYQWY